ncbi:hypothetical protein J2W50_001713 [Herbaspirillum frisingense]|uniref:GmrSD restriction endonucleases N-terminal domain-containing protein n=2 Tax=Herbaspirillum frisingense TaxID=92645 RepID=A0ABU1PCN8_9BURK|nr:hypothetical protein [Herbaspirillum frisingense]
MPSKINREPPFPTKQLTEKLVDEWYESEDEIVESEYATPDDLSKKYADTQLRVVRSTVDFTLHQLQASFRDSNYINLAPGYQRRARWDRKKKSLLIESFLLNVPVPPLFLFENDYNQYEVMDGRQRLETITEFLDNGFALLGLEYWPELNGSRYRDLPQAIQRGLLRRTVGAVVLLAETARGDGNFDIRMVLFRRLNTGGIKLNPQELRNAAYPGNFNELLRELSRCDLFTTLWAIPKKTESEEFDDPPASLLKNVLYQSMMDCELVLRFFGIRETIEGTLKGSLRHILDRTMERKKNITKSEVEHLKLLFLKSLQALMHALGPNFIVLPESKRPSRPLYDALTVAASFLTERELNSLGQRSQAITNRLRDALAREEEYDVLVGRGNTVEAIKARVELARTILLASG